MDGRVRGFRRRYLPRCFSLTGNYGTDVYTNTACFLLVSHSELETYFEQLVVEKVSTLVAYFQLAAVCPASQAALSALFAAGQPSVPATIAEIKSGSYIRSRQLAAAHSIRLKAENNQGIKTKNILPLFIPLGLDETNIDQDLLRDLDALGVRRGDVAHHALHDIQLLPDPKEAKELVFRIISKLAAFEKLVI